MSIFCVLHLPQTIEDDTLKDNFVDLFDSCYDNESCCDVCEMIRDARECVYNIIARNADLSLIFND